MDKYRQQLHFIGVTTGGSTIRRLFPVWAGILGLDAGLVGRDVPIGAGPDAYRRSVAEIADEPAARGALVTTHKVSVYRHAGDLFAEFDAYARLTEEVSCISKRPDEALVGQAKDPITADRSLQDMLPGDHWVEHPAAEALCMGAGGAGTAISVALGSREHPPARIVVTDRDPDRLRDLQAIHQRMDDLRCDVAYVHADEHDRVLEALPPGSLVINATGMGKDIPGSPISERARFPEHAVVWELNYRGERPFLASARQQAADRSLRVHDGWRYFLHGWTAVIAEVFRLDLSGDRFERLADAADPFRGA